MRSITPISLVLLAFLSYAAADDHLVLYCNRTGPCRPCKSRRHDLRSSCTLDVYQQEVKCVVDDDDDDYPHARYHVVLKSKKNKYDKHQIVKEYASCDLPSRWSFVRFELVLIVGLVCAVVVIRWRQTMSGSGVG